MNTLKCTIISILALSYACSNQHDALKQTTYETVYVDSTGGCILQPGDSFRFDMHFRGKNYPVRRILRISGGTVMPSPFHRRGEELFRQFQYHIDDCIDTIHPGRKRNALVFEGENDSFDRSCWYRLRKAAIQKGRMAEISFECKASHLVYHGDGNLSLEVQIYLSKSGRHPDDLFDGPDSVVKTIIEPGNYDWKTTQTRVFIPPHTACLVFRIGGKGFSGSCYVEPPQITWNGKMQRLPEFNRYDEAHESWIGENLSSKEWPVFIFRMDGKIFFEGKIFDRASDIADFEIDLPDAHPGKHTIDIILVRRAIPLSYPYQIRDIGLLEQSNREMELVHVPEYVFYDSSFAVLFEINKAHTRVAFDEKKGLVPSVKEHVYEETGLHVVRYHVSDQCRERKLTMSYNGKKVSVPLKQILVKENDNVMLSCSDDIYIARNRKVFSGYLQWYLQEGIGNAYVFRPSYQWSGSRGVDTSFYRWAAGLMKELNMHYSLMVEGRSMAEKDINPPDGIIRSSFYMGRQAHENDGAFYYWGHFRYIGLFTDLFAQLRPYGGIFARTRVKYTDKGNVVYQNPYACKDMADGASTFVNNLREARGQSTRHTGPTTLFRYFFQAGYEWTGAEQMYGPEEIIMAALRGACRAYGKKDYGTHLATQWSSGPYDDSSHAERLFLSLAISYIHGATHINTEDGLWNTEDNHNRYTQAGKEHIAMQKRMYDFILTHSRRGQFVAPAAILQGRNDAWRCFVRKGSAWSQAGEQWKYGPAEYSFDLLKVFYPGSKPDAIYVFPCPRQKQGWYTGFPYGPVDILPVEAPDSVLQSYRALAFLGWNTFQEDDFARLLRYVVQGGTLLLGRAHINAELNHGKSPRLPQKSQVLEELLGKNYHVLKGIIRRNVGKGTVIYFASKEYPVDSSVYDEYCNELKKIGHMMVNKERTKGWVKGNDEVQFTAYDNAKNNSRTIYLLNTGWWKSEPSAKALLLIGNEEYDISVRRKHIEVITI